MRKTKTAAVISVILLGFLPFAAFSQSSNFDISLSSKLDRTKLRVGEKARFEVTVRWSGLITDYDIGTSSSPALVGLRMLSTESSVGTEGEAGKTVKRTMIYELEATDAGKGRIGAVELTIHDRKSDRKSTLSTEPLEIEVHAAPEPLFSFPEITARKALGLGLILIALIAGGAGMVLYFRRDKSRVEIGEKPAPATPEQAFDDVVRKAGNLRFSGDVQTYMTALEGAIIRWIEARFALNPRQWPDIAISEFSARSLMPDEHVEYLRQFARCCQAAKFAGKSPAAEELDRLVQRLSTVVHYGTDPSPQGSKDKT